MRSICRAGALALCLLGCSAAGESPAPTFEELVDEHREQSDIDFRDCGTLTIGASCGPTFDPAEQCLLDAWEACEPAELRLRDSPDRGGAINNVWLIETAGTSCRVTWFVDASHTQQLDGAGDYQRHHCRAYDGYPYDKASGTCGFTAPSDCSADQEWDAP